MRAVESFKCGEWQMSEAKSFLRMTACVGCEIQRSGLPRRCERSIRAVVHSHAAAIAQTIDNLVGRMYERVRRFIRPKRKHDAAHQHAGRRERGGRQTGTGCPRVRASQTRARPARREPSILCALSPTTCGERRRHQRTRRPHPRGTFLRRRRSHEPFVRELRASQPPPCGASLRARAAREGGQAPSRPLPEHAHSRRHHVLRIGRRGFAGREPSWNGGRREAQRG
jgi:hypothetical protein